MLIGFNWPFFFFFFNLYPEINSSSSTCKYPFQNYEKQTNNLQVNDACFAQNHLPFPCPLSTQKNLELKRGAEDFSGCEDFICLFRCKTNRPLAYGKKHKFLPFENITEAAAPRLFWVCFLWAAWSCDIVHGGRLAGAWWWEGSRNAERSALCGLTAGLGCGEAAPGSDGCGRGSPRAGASAFLRSPKPAHRCWLVNTILGEKSQSWALKTAERSEKNKARGIHSNWMKF